MIVPTDGLQLQEIRRVPIEARIGDPHADDAKRAARGDVEAAHRLCLELGPVVLRTLRTVLGHAHPDIDDLGQESLVALFEGLASFEFACSVRHYARRIATHKALTAARDKRRNVAKIERVEQEADALSPARQNPADEAARSQLRALMSALLSTLSEAQAETLILHFVFGHSIEETAAMLGTPVNTVRGRLVTTKQVLRQRIERDPKLADLAEFAQK
jgi:RNA polymerase sigma-70 factor (ECF subfamily)